MLSQTVWHIRQQRRISLSRCCRQLGIIRQSIYQGRDRQEKRMEHREQVRDMVLDVRRELPKVGGRKLYYLLSDRITDAGIKMGRDGLFDTFRMYGLLIKPERSYTKTTDSKHWMREPPLLKDTTPERPDQVYVSGISYVKSLQRTHNLSLVTDAFSRKIVGWHLSDDLSSESVVQAMRMAVRDRAGSMPLIHHSDRGLQYCSEVYQKVLAKNNVTPSMTDGYDCYQNALADGGVLDGYLDSGLLDVFFYTVLN